MLNVLRVEWLISHNKVGIFKVRPHIISVASTIYHRNMLKVLRVGWLIGLTLFWGSVFLYVFKICATIEIHSTILIRG